MLEGWVKIGRGKNLNRWKTEVPPNFFHIFTELLEYTKSHQVLKMKVSHKGKYEYFVNNAITKQCCKSDEYLVLLMGRDSCQTDN